MALALCILAALLAPAALLPALAAEAAREQIAIGQSVAYTGVENATLGYTFDSSALTAGETVGAMMFNISIDLPLEGDPSWNDWCGAALTVTAGGGTKYYDFGGREVGWGIDFDGDGAADTGGKDTESWVGSAANGALTLAVPVNAKDFTIDFYDNCWDSVEGPHYTVNSAIALYGEVAAAETVAVGAGVGYTGVGGTDPAFVFSSDAFASKGNVAAVAFNISIDLPLEGDPSWNDWCGELLAVTAGGETAFFDFGGKEVGWGVDFDGDGAADTGGKDTESWVGSAANGTLSILVPVDAEAFEIAFYDNCWDSVEGPHYTIHSAAALFGSVTEGGAKPAGPEKPPVPDFDPNGTYHAYLCVQSKNYIFRDSWADFNGFGYQGAGWGNYAIGDNFSGLTGWDGPDAVKYNGVFTDAEIKGNGTYRVELNDYDFAEDESFNMFFLSTDIPIAGNPAAFTDVKAILGGSTKYTFAGGYVTGVDTTDAKDYYEVQIINAYNAELGGETGLFPNMIPASGVIAIEFTVSGFAYDKADDEPVAEPSSSPADGGLPADYMPSNEPEDEGAGFPVWGIVLIIVGAVAVIGCAVFFIVKKKKK
jgi:hypothetical protein